MTSKWVDTLSVEEIEANFKLTASLDPAFAAQAREFYETRTPSQLKTLAAQAWNCNDADGYQMARSFLALREAA